MSPRGYFATFGTFAAFTAIPFAAALSLVLSAAVNDTFAHVLWPFGLSVGLAFGLVFGAVMASSFKGITARLPVSAPDAFLTHVALRLAELGYHPDLAVGDCYTFKPSWQAGMLAGRVTVKVSPVDATVVGPARYVRELQRRLQADSFQPAHPHRSV